MQLLCPLSPTLLNSDGVTKPASQIRLFAMIFKQQSRAVQADSGSF